MRRIAPVIVLVLAMYLLCWAEVYPNAFVKVTAGHTVTALASGRSSPKAEVNPEYRFLIYQPKSTDIPMPVPIQQETQQAPQRSQQGETQQPQQEQAQPPPREGEQQQYQEQYPEQERAQPQPERAYGWGYAWWWWIVIAAIIIFFIIIFAAWGGRGGRGGA